MKEGVGLLDDADYNSVLHNRKFNMRNFKTISLKK